MRNETGELVSFDWPIVSTFQWLCKSDKDCEKLIGIFGPDPDGPVPTVYKCGNSMEYNVTAGGKMDIDGVRENGSILYDLINFNNVGYAILAIFQILTQENWTDGNMYNYMDASNTYVAIVFFVALVIFGAFFILNLVLAQIILSFEQENETIEENQTAEERLRTRVKDIFH